MEEIGIFGYFGIQGGMCELPVGVGIPGVSPINMVHYPVAGDIWGNDVVWDHARHFDADVIITLLDAWVFKPDYGHGGFLWVAYAPVDHEPIPPPVLDRLRRSYQALAYSQHAKRSFQGAGLPHDYIPHGVETKVLKPLDKGGKREAKKWIGIEDPDTFVIGTVAAHKGWPARKGFSELFEAFSIFHKRHPDSALYLHSQVQDSQGNAPNLTDVAKHFEVADAVRFTTPYVNFLGFSAKEMRDLYNGFDVFCLPSMGEGFGIPIVEAQACGVPVIVSDWTACAELCGAGWKIPMGKKYFTQLQSYQAFVDVDALALLMETAYEAWKNPASWESLQRRAREFAMQYDWDVLVRDKWSPWVEDLWAKVRMKTIQRPESSSLAINVSTAGSEVRVGI